MFTDVQFPLVGLDMKPYLSNKVTNPFSEDNSNVSTIYDLSGVVHHSGGINGGHYIAHVASNNDVSLASAVGPESGVSMKSSRVIPPEQTSASWVCFNDASVSTISPKYIVGPSAYVLFYKLRK